MGGDRDHADSTISTTNTNAINADASCPKCLKSSLRAKRSNLIYLRGDCHGAARLAMTNYAASISAFVLVEATNVFHRRVLLGQISQSQAKELLTGLLNRGIEIKESPQLHIQALELAQELQLPAVYDTHYLALAEMLECDLWTADEKFFNSVKGRYPRVKWLGNYHNRER